MSILEAMAAGVPVAATAVGGVPEILPADAAQLVAPGDDAGLAHAVARLLDEPGLASTQSEAARRRMEERYTAERNAEATLGLYERLRRGDAAAWHGRASHRDSLEDEPGMTVRRAIHG